MARYSLKEIAWLEKNIAGRGYAELTKIFNRRFGVARTEAAIRFAASSRGMSNGLHLLHYYTSAQIRFLERTVPGRGFEEAAKLFNKRFGLRLGYSQIKAAARNRGITTGRDCRFRPGNVPFNTGKKGWSPPGSEKGWFKPGEMPYTWVPVGTELINTDGYLVVKVADRPKGGFKKNWAFKHRLIWEKAYGKIPRGHIVIFADGDKLNTQLDNLLLVSRGEHAVMNRWGFRSAHKELTKTGKAVADIKMLISERKRATGRRKAGRGRKSGRKGEAL
ncbi:MAG: HNH endonuclease [Treponema sp.]|jgi:hypothetical protein|nr:HNH endonuclease [Treponema sp.]